TDTGWAKAAWGCLFGQWILGARVFVHNTPRFETKVTLHLLSTAGITSFCAPPTAYRVLVQEDELQKKTYPTLRHCTSAGEPLNPEAIAIWKKATGLSIYDGYGQTETVNIVANYPCLPIKPGSMGKPTPGFDVAVIDDEGN
ncbi:TPA: acyl-CoA synthetase, partial [Candidatus Sumerlaeota bacterium]|nr:acyl-CoA synthetase [Candidatus Sumerlaeota bacterium]